MAIFVVKVSLIPPNLLSLHEISRKIISKKWICPFFVKKVLTTPPYCLDVVEPSLFLLKLMTRAISMFSVIWCGPCWLIYHRGRSNRTHDDDDQKSTSKRLELHGSLIIICQWGFNIKRYPWTRRRNDLMNSSTNNHRAYLLASKE